MDVDGGCVPIGLPMRELLLELIRLFELTAGCCVTVEGRVLFILPIRVLVRLVELNVCRLVHVLPVVADLLEPILLDVGLRTFELVLGREAVERLDVILVELRLGVVLLGWRTLGVLAGLLRLTELELPCLAEG